MNVSCESIPQSVEEIVIKFYIRFDIGERVREPGDECERGGKCFSCCWNLFVAKCQLIRQNDTKQFVPLHSLNCDGFLGRFVAGR